MIGYTFLRKQRNLPISLVRDLTVYLTPTKADFEVLVESNAKGKKHRISKKARFPMRTLPLDEELLQHRSDYFSDLDQLIMMFVLVVGMSAGMLILKQIVPQHTQTNLTFYLNLVLLFLVASTLTKDCFALGWFKYTDETKVQILFGIKSFVLVWCVYCYTEVPALMGTDIDSAHEQMNLRLNQVLALSRTSFSVPVEASYFGLALLASIISFCVTKISINFAYYFFVMTRAFGQSELSDTKEKDQIFSSKQLRTLVYLTLLAPGLILLLFIDELAFSLVKELITLRAWQVLRMLPVGLFGLLRLGLFRDEVQF